MENEFEIIAKTFFGLEDVLADEIKNIGGKRINPGNRSVGFYGDKEMLYKANLYLRTALRVLKPFLSFKVKNEKELYNIVYKFDWNSIIGLKDTFAIDSVVHSKLFKHSKYVALKAKDAIADYFYAKYNARPSVNIENPTVRLNVHINFDLCTISLDSSGESLHKRGYRLPGAPAPLNETLAAGIVILSGWNGGSVFIDPMCGSGTTLIEAAMIGLNIPPGLNKKFGFMNWKDYDKELWKSLIKTARRNRGELENKITGYDISKESIETARDNITKAKLDEHIVLKQAPFEETSSSLGKGVIVMNPPYGERLKKDDMFGFYESIGNTLKQNYEGFEAWILSSNTEALKHIGLRTSKRLTLFNGALECKFHQYSLYKGTKKKTYES